MARKVRTIGVRELKQRATQVARSVREDGEPYLITNRGRAFAVITPLPRDWEERVLAEALAADLAAAEEDLRRGRTVSLETALARRRGPAARRRPPRTAAAAKKSPRGRQ